MMRPVYLVLGWIFVVIGLVGVVTPLLPTTPFLLLAAACFARSSDKFHQWLLTHPKLGRPILDWQEKGIIRRPAKITASVVIFLSSLFPVFIIDNIPVLLRLTVVVTLIFVCIFIWTRPSEISTSSAEKLKS